MKHTKRIPSKREKTRRQHSTGSGMPVVLIALGGLALAVLIFFLLRQDGAQNVQPVRVGSRLSDFALMDIAGEKVRLSDYEGQVVLVNTWATWCPPCRAEMPALNAYYQNHAAEGFVILAVNAGDTAGDAAAFAQEYGLAFPVILDPQTRLLNELNIHNFPTSILVDRDGVVKDIHIGMLTPEQIEAKVGPLLRQ
jgi:peroxiredoxin